MQKMTIDELISHWEMAFKISDKMIPPNIKENAKYKNPMFETIEALKELKALKEKKEWIPCSEGLPEKTGEYIVMIERATIPTTLRYFKNKKAWADAYNIYYTVVAWRELPEPYKGDNNG